MLEKYLNRVQVPKNPSDFLGFDFRHAAELRVKAS